MVDDMSPSSTPAHMHPTPPGRGSVPPSSDAIIITATITPITITGFGWVSVRA